MRTGKDEAPGTWAVATSLALAVAPTVYLPIAPFYHGLSVATSAGPGMPDSVASVVSRTRATLLEVNGWSALLPLLIPVVVAAAPLLWTRPRSALLARGVAAVVLLGFVVVTGFSIGMFYLPSAVAMLVAGLWIPARWMVRRF